MKNKFTTCCFISKIKSRNSQTNGGKKGAKFFSSSSSLITAFDFIPSRIDLMEAAVSEFVHTNFVSSDTRYNLKIEILGEIFTLWN